MEKLALGENGQIQSFFMEPLDLNPLHNENGNDRFNSIEMREALNDGSSSGRIFSSKACRASLKIRESFSQIIAEDNTNRKACPFELHSAIFSMGILVPLDIVVSIFKDADNDNAGALEIVGFSGICLTIL